MNLFNFKKKHIVLVLLLFLCIVYFQVLHRQKKDNSVFQIPFFLIKEIQTTSVNFRSGLTSLVSKYLFLIKIKEENRKLKQENSQLITKQSLFQEIQIENNRLKESLDFLSHQPLSLTPAKIIAKDALYPSESFTINKGSRHGIKKYMGVVHPKGVVGYIFRTTAHSSEVITLLSKRSSLPVINQRSRVKGLIDFYRLNHFIFKYFLNLETNNHFQVKDKIVTSQTEQFPSGIPVGIVSKVTEEPIHLNLTILVTPFVPFSSLEEVFIITHKKEKLL